MNVNVRDADEIQQTPAALGAYLSLDLSPEGTLARNLNERVASDASMDMDTVPLSPIEGPQPAHLTTGMLNWYGIFVGPKRGLALHAIASVFKEQADRAKGEGFLLQTRLAAIEEEHLQGRLQCYKHHKQQHHADSEQIKQLDGTISRDLEQYRMRKAQLGREAKVLNRPLYLTVLFFVIFGSEAAINLESFEALPWATPAIAWGATIIIGIAIGLAAHYHGTVFKQYGYWFGADQHDNKRGPAWRMVIGGSLALMLSLAFVYDARSAYLVAYSVALSGFGQTGGFQPLSTIWVIGGSLLGNIIVYLVGVLWAYLLHDSDPEFEDLKKSLDRNTQTVDVLKRRLEQHLHRDVEQLNAILKRKTEEAKRANIFVATQPNLAWAQGLFSSFQSKDQEVVALLQEYRGQLIQKMGPAAKKVKFAICCDDPYSDRKNVSSDEYLHMALKLKYLEEA